VLCPWDHPAPFTRSWCLWEIFATLDAGIRLEVQVVPRQELAFVLATMESHDSIELAWCQIDARKAGAFNPADKAMIDGAVVASAGGFDAVNGRIHHELRKWLGTHSDRALMFMRRLLTQRARTLGKTHEDTMWTLKKVAGLLRDMERYDDAEARFRELLRVRRQVHGDGHADVFAAMHDVALSIAHNDVLSDPSKLAEAEELFRAALDGRKRLLGVCTELADTEVGLAYLINRTGRLREAEELLRAAVPHCRETRHLQLYSVMNNLAAKLMHRGATGVAVAMFREALAGQIAAKGEEHSMALNLKANLASALMLQGKRDEAAALLRPVVAVTRVMLGPRHARTLAAEQQLSCCESGADFEVHAQGGGAALREGAGGDDAAPAGSDDAATQSAFQRAAYMYAHNQQAEAVPPLEAVLRAAERAPAGVPSHVRVQTVNMLFCCLLQLKRYAPAAAMCDSALALHRAEMGPTHEMTLVMIQNAAALHLKLDAYDKAEPLNREALAGFVALRGEAHPHSMSGVKNLAIVLGKQRRWGEAEELYRRVLALRMRALGALHPDTLKSKSDLALFLAEAPASQARSADAGGATRAVSATALAAALAGMGLTASPATAAAAAAPAESESIRLFRDELEAQRAELGDTHERTLASVNNLAIHLVPTRPEEAERLYREALAARAAKLGDWHSDTTDVRYNLAMLLFRRRVETGEAAQLLFGLQRHYARRLGEADADAVETRAALARLLAEQLARCFQGRHGIQ
jgi:tetratricopeptide (TPR) repeat protein